MNKFISTSILVTSIILFQSSFAQDKTSKVQKNRPDEKLQINITYLEYLQYKAYQHQNNDAYKNEDYEARIEVENPNKVFIILSPRHGRLKNPDNKLRVIKAVKESLIQITNELNLSGVDVFLKNDGKNMGRPKKKTKK